VLALLVLGSLPWEGEARRRAVTVVGGTFAWPTPISPDGAWSIAESNGFGWGVYSAGTPRQMAWVVQATHDGTLDKAEWRWGRVFSAFTTLRVSFQDLDGSGNPDGTQDQYRDIPAVDQVSNTWYAPGLMTSDGSDIGTKRTVSQGDIFAVVLSIEDGTGELYGSEFVVSGADGEVSGFYANRRMVATVTPTWSTMSAGAASSGAPFALKYDDGSYAPFLNLWSPLASRATNTFNSASSPDERALYFSLDAPMRVTGAWLSLDLDANADLVLYDTDGTTVLTSASLLAANRGSTGEMLAWTSFDDAVDLPVGTGYRLSLKPTSTSDVSGYTVTVATNAHFGAMGGGTGMYLSTREDAGSWTETTTSRPLMGLVLTGAEVGGGGGGAGATSFPFVGGLARWPGLGWRP
jgi:hypothetical protein